MGTAPSRIFGAHRTIKVRLVAVSGFIALTAGLAVAGGNAHAAPTFTTPTFSRTIGSASKAFVYPFGMAWDPTVSDSTSTGSLMVDDYTNYDLKRFGADGKYMQSYEKKGTMPGNIGEQPSGIAVNPTNGDFVVAFAFDGYGYNQYNTDGTLECIANIGEAAWYSPYITINSAGDVFLVQSTSLSPSQPNVVYTFDNFCRPLNLASNNGMPFFGANGTNCADGQFGVIRGIDVDAQGNIFVNDVSNACVQVFTSGGAFIGEFGNKSLGMTNATGLSKDTRGMGLDKTNTTPGIGVVYIADSTHADVPSINYNLNSITAGVISASWAGIIGVPESKVGGACTGQGVLDGPRGIAVGPTGTVYVSDYTCWTIDTFTPFYATTGTPGGWLNQVPDPTIPPPAGGFNGATGIAVSSNGKVVYVADTFNERAEEFQGVSGTKPGTYIQQWGSRQPNLAGSGSLDYPRGIAVDPADPNGGTVWISDTRSGYIKQYVTTVGPPAKVTGETVFGGAGTFPGQGQFFYSDGIAEGPEPPGMTLPGGEALYIPDSGVGYFQVTDTNGTLLSAFPCGIVESIPTVITGCPTAAVDANGIIYAPSFNQGVIDVFTPGSASLGCGFTLCYTESFIGATAPGGSLNTPYGVAVLGTTLYVTQEGSGTVSEFTTSGAYLGGWSSWTNTTTHAHQSFSAPMGIAVDAAGDIYVLDHLNNRVDVCTP